MQKTKNYGLKKPELRDYYNVEDFNNNMDVIDEKLGAIDKTVEELFDNDVTTTTETTLPNSFAGGLLIDEIGGVTEQVENPSPTNPQEIKKSVVKGVRTHWKNLVKNIATSQTEGGVSFVVNDDGTVLANGTATINADLRPIDVTSQLTLKKGRYIVSGCPKNGGDSKYLVILGTYDGSNTSRVAVDSGNGATFELSKDTPIHFVVRIVSGFTASNLVFKPMIRKADVVDDTYEPYTESSYTFSQPIELYGINGMQDILTPKEIVRKFGTITLTGSDSEGWALSGNGNNYYTTVADGKILYAKICSTHFVGGKWNDNTENVISMGNSNRCVLGISSSSFASLDELKEFLANNEVKVVYELAEEATEALPIADQIGLNSLATYDGITHVEFVYDELEPTFKGKYGTNTAGGIAIEAYNNANVAELNLSNLSKNVQTNTADISGLKSRVSSIETAISGDSRTVLWTNPDKTQEMANGVTLLQMSLEAYELYEFYLITYQESTASSAAQKQLLMARAAGYGNGNNGRLEGIIKEGDTYHYHERSLGYSYDSQAFRLGQCTYLGADCKANLANDKLIPYQIIGIK